MPFFSLIVPVFNVEEYIKDCIDSILCQSFKNFEIICVNDGSTDNSLKILESYTDARIKIISQTNQGLSAARNSGLDAARGKYIWFVDSDDKIANDSLIKLNNLIQHNTFSIIFFNANVFFDNQELKDKGWFSYRRNASGEITSLDFFNNEINNNSLTVNSCCYIFAREKYSTLKFINGIIHEDNPFFIELLFLDPDAICYSLPDNLFLRRVRDNSIMTSKPSVKHYNGYVHSIEYLLRYADEHKIKQYSYNRFLCNTAIALARVCIKLNTPIVSFKHRYQLIKFIKIKNLKLKERIVLALPEILWAWIFFKKLIGKY